MKKISLLLLLLSVSTTSFANWQWTDWNMNIQQVLKVGDGKVRETTDEEKIRWNISAYNRTAKLVGDYVAGDINFKAKFYFDESDKLTCVFLDNKDKDKGVIIRESLINKYGVPDSIKHSSFDTYRWLKDDDITYTTDSIMGNTVRYCSRNTKTGNGL